MTDETEKGVKHIMINIGELKDICERVEREYGSDTNVILQIYSQEGELIRADYVAGVAYDRAGNLFLTNKGF